MTISRQQFLTLFNIRPQQMADHTADFDHQAAVVIPMYEVEGQIQVLFTQRAQHLRHHGGQVSFPGGRYDETDGNLIETAWRECDEEVGVRPDELLGELPKYVSNSGFSISPYIGWFDSSPTLNINRSEVEFTFSVPLSHLLNPENHVRYTVKRNNRTLDVYWIRWQHHYIWGVTAGILHTLYSHLAGSGQSAEYL